MTKVTIVSGFLGAGKTTLIKKLLKEAYAGQKIVLIENEFGEIGVDSGFLKDAGIQVSEMNSGCICCSLVGDFGKALKEVLTTYQPDRILIEPSGVGKLSDVWKAVERVEEAELQIEASVTVVDGKKCRAYLKNFGEFFSNQVEHAQIIIMSRTQNMTQDQLREAVGLLREHNEKSAIITTPWDEISGKQIVGAIEGASQMAEELLREAHEHHREHDGECCHEHGHHHGHDGECCHEHGHHHDHDGECCHEHGHHHDHDGECCHEHEHHHDHDGECRHEHGHHHADEVFTSWGAETPEKYTREEIQGILKTLSESGEYGGILRAKGMVDSADGEWIYFDMVPGEYEVRAGEPDYTGRLCVIGTELQEDNLKTLFHV